MRLYRHSSGLIFEDQFNQQLDPKWIASPSKFVTWQERKGFARLNRNMNDVFLLMQTPEQENFIMEVDADYVPIRESDFGGLLVWKNDKERLEFLETADTTETEYSRWRVSKNGGQYHFSAYKNGSWELIDSATLDSKKIGIVAKGATGALLPIDVERVTLTSSDLLTVTNLDPGSTVNVYIEEKLYQSQTLDGQQIGVQFKLDSLHINAKIEILKGEEVIDSLTGVFYGGDVLQYGTFLELHHEGKHLDRVDLNFMKQLCDRNGAQLRIYNPNTVPAKNIQVTVQQFKDRFGYEQVKLSYTTNPLHDVTELSFASIEPGEYVDFMMKVELQNDTIGIDLPTFYIDINHE
ncbi:hypothetical protein [Bacillus chungangensis]|uniref:Cell adhesion protein n=1 Tax=Bacillus chungangensis TaxID=587633 RepID=A0ABT9WTX1_9BACI|nr:hypothetical protein [Bacillus chungangensis]MDQ0176737.1 hypothetical protein [Bacillus chungangensis]